MKTILKSITFMLLVAALVSCRSAGLGDQPAVPSQPAAQTQSAPDSGDTGTTNRNGGPAANSVPTARPTTPAVAALSSSLPAFDGLYWSNEVGVIPISETAVRVISGLSCEDLLSLLSAGEWLVTQQAEPQPDQAGMFSTLARMQKGDQVALIDVKGFVFSELTAEGDSAGAAQTFPGCSGTVQILQQQSLSASGVEQAEGSAMQYPFMGGCTTVDGQTQVRLFYEGPGDFRASLDFTVPAETGEYGAEESDISLSIQRSEKDYVQTFADLYASGMASVDGDEDQDGTEYYPMSEEAGVVRVTSTSPLAGEVVLTDMANDWGETQAFSAGWSCP